MRKRERERRERGEEREGEERERGKERERERESLSPRCKPHEHLFLRRRYQTMYRSDNKRWIF